LVLGSGAIKIAEAGEFDYAGSQALKALKEEGLQSVLVNPNIATIQSDLAHKVYFLPVNAKHVERVIEEERPDGILLGFGGQTALNCGFELKTNGVLDKYGVKVLGTPVEAIERASNRELFRNTMLQAGISVLESKAAYTLEQALAAAHELGYPVIVRTAFTLGGKGGGVALNEEQLKKIASRGIAHSIVGQVLIEKYIGSWKQIEYEVMRDYKGNSVVVCNMENILGMRVHTGDNIVVAPSQTLNDEEYQLLRSVAIKAAGVVGVIGECNVQFALDPLSQSYYVIEINPRLSRSSALASKATGYPIAYIATKLALGYTLSELTNGVTNITTACFEPSLDYVVVKMPRFDFSKFKGVSHELGTQMKSVGEVMAIGRTFEEALQKAIRMLEIGKESVCDYTPLHSKDALIHALSHPTHEFLFHVAQAIEAGFSVEEISKLSWVDPWFIKRIEVIVRFNSELKKRTITRELLLEAKRLGFSDAWIAKTLGLKEEEVRRMREKMKVKPVVKRVDSLAAEWPARTNYFYLTYEQEGESRPERKNRIVVLGGGSYRIGSSVEFDWATMNMVWALQKKGYEVTVVNCNPETVSTDYDTSDALYFEELTLERILDIVEVESPLGVVCCVGGQTPNNLVTELAKSANILGTQPESVKIAEERALFSKLLESLGIPQPPWIEAKSFEQINAFAQRNYPVIIRPSFVLSGSSMRVVRNEQELKACFSQSKSFVVSKFIEGAFEVEVDAVSDGENVLIGAVMEHLEKAGTHSGDATVVIPPIRISQSTQKIIEKYTKSISRALKIKGPFNIQFLVKDGKVYMIECNLRASRSMPFVSKTTGINLIQLAANVITGDRLEVKQNKSKRFGVKFPQFSFMQLEGSDPVLGVEMKSTGEVACFGDSFYEALRLAMEAVGYRFEPKRVVVDCESPKLKSFIKTQFEQLGVETCEFIEKADLVISIPKSGYSEWFDDRDEHFLIRRMSVEFGVPLLTSFELVQAYLEVLKRGRLNELR